MNISILTHPFRGNYGGMLQAYALRKVLRDWGHRPHLHRCYKGMGLLRETTSWLKGTGYIAKEIMGVLGQQERCPFSLYKRMAERFLSELETRDNVAPFSEANTDCWVVGSDQVWRAGCGRTFATLPYFFLSEVPKDIRNASISYAASFGTDQWEGSDEETKLCQKLLPEFAAVSVRETSGVGICRDVFGVQADQMPDPTLLLKAQDYSNVICWEQTHAE